MAIQENCQKSSQPHQKIVKQLHGCTEKLSNKNVGSWPDRKIVKKLHDNTGKLSKSFMATQKNCQTIILMWGYS